MWCALYNFRELLYLRHLPPHPRQFAWQRGRARSPLGQFTRCRSRTRRRPMLTMYPWKTSSLVPAPCLLASPGWEFTSFPCCLSMYRSLLFSSSLTIHVYSTCSRFGGDSFYLGRLRYARSPCLGSYWSESHLHRLNVFKEGHLCRSVRHPKV